MNDAQSLAESLDKIAKLALNQRVAQGWADLLHCESGTAEFNAAMVAIQEKVQLLENVIASSEISERAKGLYSSALTAVRPFIFFPDLYNSLIQQVKAQQSQIDLLFLAADVLPKRLTSELNPVTSSVLVDEIQELIDSINSASIDFRLKSLILNQLKLLLVAINSYDTLGPEGAAKLFGSAAATLAQAANGTGSNESESAGILKRSLAICKKTGAAIIFLAAVSGGAHGIIEDGRDLLGIETGVDSGESSDPKGETASEGGASKSGKSSNAKAAKPSAG